MRRIGLGFGFGFNFRPRYGASGGTPTPPFAFPSSKMNLGMGLTGINSASGLYPFANVLWNAYPWERTSGSADWSQEWGVITQPNADGPTDTYRAKIWEGTGDNLPHGTYTVLNPNGCEIGVGAFGSQNLAAYTTEEQFTFSYTSEQLVALHARGPVSGVQIIMPGRLAAFQAGDYWNPDFLAFEQSLGLKCFRFMDWVQAYHDLTENWSDVPTDLPMMFSSKHTQLMNKVPYSLIVDLCNRLDVDPWINIPARASDDFVDELSAFFAANLDSNRYVYIEAGNEPWNFLGPFNDARVWFELLDFTRYEATPNSGINGWTRAAHGLSTGDLISSFATVDNFTRQPHEKGMVYPLGFGITLYVEAVDANNFKLYEDVARTIPNPPDPSDMSAEAVAKRNNYATLAKIVYKKRAEDGKTASVNTNYGEQSLNWWTRFDAALGRNRCVHVLGTQYANATVTSGRLAVSGVAAATDCVAIAPYYSGDWFVGCMDIASGQMTPKAWQKAAGTMRCGVYASGSTPTITEVLTGTGAGYIAHRDIVIPSNERVTYSTGTAITGLTNGTTYEVRFVLTGSFGDNWMASGTATVSATPSTVAFTDSDADMALRARRRLTFNQNLYMTEQIAAAGGKPLVGYESAADYFGNNLSLAEVVAWRNDYLRSAESGAVFEQFYRTMASYGVKLTNQFGDINASAPGSFSIAGDLDDTTHPSYVVFEDFGGEVSQTTLLTQSGITAIAIPTEPSYPATVHTFTSGPIYTIASGNNDGLFEIVGNDLRLVSGGDINWDILNSLSLVIEARNVTSAFFTLAVDLGTLAAGGVAAPTLTGSPTLLASWDFADDSTITDVSGAVSAISGADGTSVTLTGPGSTANPTIATAGGKQVATFASASSQRLEVTSASGVSGAASIVVVVKMNGTTTAGLVEVANSITPVDTSRLALLLSSTTGFQARQHDNSATQSIAAFGSLPNTTDPHLVIGTFPNAAASAPKLNANGQGTAVSGSPNSNAAAGIDRTTVGVRRANGSYTSYANMSLFRVLIYSGELTSTQKEEIAAWAATNYGTANNA